MEGDARVGESPRLGAVKSPIHFDPGVTFTHRHTSDLSPSGNGHKKEREPLREIVTLFGNGVSEEAAVCALLARKSPKNQTWYMGVLM
jgi:hypothetical protein